MESSQSVPTDDVLMNVASSDEDNTGTWRSDPNMSLAVGMKLIYGRAHLYVATSGSRL